jgi:hypothetical protein
VITHLPFLFVHEILSGFPAPEEEDRLANLLAILRHLAPLTNEPTEGSNTGTGANHDDRLGWVRGELEVGVADVDRDLEAVIFVAWAVNLVREAKGSRVRVAILLLLESKEVVGRDTAERIVTAREHL